MEVVLMLAQVLREVVDALGQESDLHLCRSHITFVRLIFLDEL